jgi:hypothetical protein
MGELTSGREKAAYHREVADAQADVEQHHTKLEAAAAVNKLRQFIGKTQIRCLSDLCRGEERQYFIDKLCALAELVSTMPKTYEQDGLGKEAIAYLHYFTSGTDHYITEKDMEAEQHQAFGSANIGYGPELGYISIVELLSCGAELDLYFEPKTLATIEDRK